MMDEWAAFCAAPSVKAGVACRDVRFQVFQTVTIDPQPSFKYALSNVCSSALCEASHKADYAQFSIM